MKCGFLNGERWNISKRENSTMKDYEEYGSYIYYEWVGELVMFML